MSVEQISENIWFILFAYIAAFLPWSFLAAKDFVGPRWKTVKETRTSGKYTAAFSVIPACYVTAYMIVQGLSTDYKEMSAALVALVFSCLNFLRTLWGLWQLHFFREWAISSILALKEMGVPYVATFPEAGKFNEIDDIVDHLLVNETIVDNQLAHGEAKCFLKYRDIMLNGGKNDQLQVLRHLHNICKGFVIVVRCCIDYGRQALGHAPVHKIEMVPVQPANVWLNWSVAFVAQGLGGWLKDFSAPVDPENEPGYNEATSRERLERRGQHFGLQLINSALLQLWYEDERCEHGSSTSPFHWCGLWDENSVMQDGVVVKKELLRKAMESGIAMPFQASHDILIGKGAKQTETMRPGYHAYRRKLLQIVNEIPVRGEFDEKVGEFDTEKLEWLSIVLYLGTVAVGRRRASSEKLTVRKSAKETSGNGEEEIKGSQALKNLRTQVYLRNSSESPARNYAQLSSTSELFQCVSVRITQPPKVFFSEYNRHVAKVGEMVDAWLSLLRGSKMTFLSHLNESNFWEDICRFRHSCNTEEKQLDIFSPDESEAIQAIHAEVEKRRFYYNFANTAGKYDSCDQFMTFMGYGMETVRSRLGSWVVQNQDVTWSDERFAPLMENFDEVGVDLGLQLSQVLFGCLKECNLSHCGFQTRLLWELQQALAKSDDRGPESVRIVMLCVLSFPSVRFEVIRLQKEEQSCPREEVTCKTKESCVLVGFDDCVGRKRLPCRKDDKRRSFARIKIYASGGPQRVEILGTFSERNGRLYVNLRLVRSEEVKRFRWTLWRDAFLGRLKGLKEWQEEHGILSAELNLTYGEMKGTVENVELPTGENAVCWGGWKPFRFEFMRFELESEGFLKEQFVAREEHAEHLLRRLYNSRKQRKDHEQLLTWQARISMYYCLDSLPRMSVEPVDYEKASGITLRNAFLIVEEALVGEATDARGADDGDPSKLLIRYAEECPSNGNDLERAVSVLEIAATVYGSGIALEQCVRLLIEQSREKMVAIRVLRLLERFLAQLYSALSLIDPEPSLLFHTDQADDYLFPTCSKVMERFGDDDLISGRLSTLFAHLWLINQAHFGKKTLAALQTLYSMSADVRVMETFSQVLYDDFSSVNTDKELLRNVEHFSGLNRFLTERYASAARELNKDTLQACKAFARGATRKLEGIQRSAAEIRLATATAWGSCSSDEVYQKAVALYQTVIESSGDIVTELAIINWATLVVEGRERHSEQELEDLIGFTINYSHRHGETEALLHLAEALQRGSKDRAQLNKNAVGLYRHAIEGGDAVAMNDLALMLEYGAEGVEQDAVEASKLYRRAIEGGEVVAMTNLALMLENGVDGVAQDAVEAAKLYRDAIEHGDVKAMCNLGWMLHHGAEGVEQDTVGASKLYRRAIEGGDALAMTNLALMLEDGADGVAQDAVEAAKLYRDAIEHGDVKAMCNLGWMLQQGAEGVEQDAMEASKLYRRAIEGRDVVATNSLGEMLQYGAQRVPMDTEQAVELYRRAVETGDDDAMCNLGLILQDGTWEIAQDAAKAEELYRRAMECGNVNAMVDLALMLEDGREGVAQDAVEASKLYSRAIDGGNVDAMCNLGLMLQHGMGNLGKDTAEAAKLFRRAIEGGDADAMYNLGLMLESGAEGVAQDSEEAAKLFRRAIEYGNLDAMWNLAVLLQNGSAGVEQNIEEAKMLMSRAWEGLCNGGCG